MYDLGLASAWIYMSQRRYARYSGPIREYEDDGNRLSAEAGRGGGSTLGVEGTGSKYGQ